MSGRTLKTKKHTVKIRAITANTSQVYAQSPDSREYIPLPSKGAIMTPREKNEKYRPEA